MDKVLPQEILIKIFKYLTPIDLCFSVSLVNTLFYQLSLVNDIWSQFKCDGWSETMNVKQSKYSLPFRSSPKLDSNFFKTLYINWIKEQGAYAKTFDTVPSWYFKDTEKKDDNGNRKVEIYVAGDLILPNNLSLKEPLIGKYLKNATPSDPIKIQPPAKINETNFKRQNKKNSSSLQELDELSFQFKDSSTSFSLQEYVNNPMSRTPYFRSIQRILDRSDGLIWAINSEIDNDQQQKILSLKKYLEYSKPLISHIIVIDYSSRCKNSIFSKRISLNKQTKECFNKFGIDFVAASEVDGALEKMASTLENKYNQSFPKYLPTIEEFKQYVYKPKKNIDGNTAGIHTFLNDY